MFMMNKEQVDSLMSTAPPASEITPFLYIGCKRDAESLQTLRRVGITHILNCTKSCVANCFEGRADINIVYKRIAINDYRSEDILSHMEEAVDFIEEASKIVNARVLVHCLMGMSRACSFTLGYLMKHGGFALQDAYDYVKSQRSIIKPNESFMSQLRKYEATLKAKKTSLSIDNYLFRGGESKELTPSKMFPRSKVASNVSKTDRNLMHWFASNSKTSNVAKNDDNGNDGNRFILASPGKKKRTLMEYLQHTNAKNTNKNFDDTNITVEDVNTYANTNDDANMGTSNRVRDGNPDTEERWTCQLCTFENNYLLMNCEMCETERK